VHLSFPGVLILKKKSQACLLGAIQAVARQKGKADAVKDAKVHANVSIGEVEDMPGFGIKVDIKVEGVEDELLQAGHEVSVEYHPYF